MPKDTIQVRELNQTEGKNRFRFASFGERVKNVKIDVVHRISRVDGDSEDTESHFKQSLENWTELNCTIQFTRFVRSVRPYAQSLVQILYHKTEIVTLLASHLEEAGNLAYEPLLDLCTALVKDLQEEFYPLFPTICTAILKLLSSSDLKVLEAAFSALAYQFKYLWKEILSDIIPTYNLLEPYLKDHKPFIRRFAAEVFGVLLRKVKRDSAKTVYTHIVESLRSDPREEYVEGVGLLFFEAIKLGKDTLHSNAATILKTLWWVVVGDGDVEADPAIDMLRKVQILLGYHASKEHVSALWTYALDILQADLVYDEEANGEKKKGSARFGDFENEEGRDAGLRRLGKTMGLVAVLVGVKGGGKLQDRAPFYAAVAELTRLLFAKPNVPAQTMKALRELQQVLMLTSGSDVQNLLAAQPVLTKIFALENEQYVLAFSDTMASRSWRHFPGHVLPKVFTYIQTNWTRNPSAFLFFLSTLFGSDQFPAILENASNIWKSNGLIRLSQPPSKNKSTTKKDASPQKSTDVATELLSIVKQPHSWKTELRKIESNAEKWGDAPFWKVSAAVTCLEMVVCDSNEVFKALRDLFEAVVEVVGEVAQDASDDTSGPTVLNVFAGQVLGSLTRRCVKEGKEGRLANLWEVVTGRYLKGVRGCGGALGSVAEFVEACKSSPKAQVDLSLSAFQALFSQLESNIGSTQSNIRRNTLRILMCFEQPTFRAVKDSAFFGECTILGLCLEVENVAEDATSRERSVLLKRLDTMVAGGVVPGELGSVAVLYGLAVFSIPFTPIWADATKILCSAAQADLKGFWRIFYQRVLDVKDIADVGVVGVKTLADSLRLDDKVELEEGESVIPVQQKGRKDGRKKEDGKFAKKGLSFDDAYLERVFAASEKATKRYVEGKNQLFVSFIKRNEVTESRLDYMQYYAQLIRTLTLIPHLVENESKAIVPLFLELFRDEQIMEDQTADEDEDDDDKVDDAPKKVRSKMIEFLSMFAKVRHPTRLHESQKLYNIYMGLLTKGDSKIQALALDCILTWRQPGVVALEESLRSLADDTKFRDALSTLDMEAVAGMVKTQDRPEAMKVLMNVLYGKIISRRGRGSSRVGQKARRAAIFAFLTGVEEGERGYVVGLMVQPFRKFVPEVVEFEGEDGKGVGNSLMASTSGKDAVGTLKRFVGFLNVLKDFVKQLRSLVVPFLPTILGVVVYLVEYAEKALGLLREEENSEEALDVGGSGGAPILKDIRAQGLKRLAQIFDADLEFDFGPWIGKMFDGFIRNRIPLLTIENTQAPSALLGLFGSWSRNLKYVGWLKEYEEGLMSHLLGIMSAKKVRDPVISAVLNVVENIIELNDGHPEESLVERLLRPHVDQLLRDLDTVLSNLVNDKGRPVRLYGHTVPARVVAILAKVSAYVGDAENAMKLLELLLPFLKRPIKSVPEGTKTEILRILTNFLPVLEFAKEGVSPARTKYYGISCQMFAMVQGREGRDQLVSLMQAFGTYDEKLVEVGKLVADLNAWSEKRLDEPDFDRRFSAFTSINQELYMRFTCDQWLPILHNFIFYCQDENEFSIRTSASHGLCQFVARAVQLVESGDAVAEDMMNLITHTIFPAIKRALKINSMVVRSEFVMVLGVLIRTFPTSPMFSDMVGLLADGDDEANFFANIYHLQTHRRLKALRRLAEECGTPRLRPASVANIFIPIVAHFIFESDKVADHNLINEAISSVAACAEVLTWGHYYTVVKRFLNALTKRPTLEKAMIRVLIRVLDKFHFEMVVGDVQPMEVEEEVAKVEDKVTPMEVNGDAKETAAVEEKERGEEAAEEGKEYVAKPTGEQEAEEEEDEEEEPEEVENADHMDIDGEAAQRAKDLAIRVHDTVMSKLLPELQRYLARKDDESIPVRIPIALAIAGLLQKLPAASINIQLPKLLITLCNLLRSRGQDARDSTRDTLVKVALLLGAAYIPFILKELEGALTRGYQLHVLGYTVHSLLTHVVPTVQPGDLDACVEMLVRICVADIFGETGSEREVQELQGKMREIKTTKSFDSFELIAKIVSFRMLDVVLLPIKELMLQTSDVKMIRKIEEVFRKIALGVNANASVEVTELMIFVHGLVTENLPIAQAAEQTVKKKSAIEQQHLIQLKRNDPLQDVQKVFQANAHLFVEFGLSLLLTALKREQIDIRKQEHLQMLDPLTAQVGRSLYSKHSSVCMNAIRILSILAKAPLPKMRETMPAVVKRVLDIVARSLSTSAEIVQAAFRLLTIVLRDCKYVDITQHQLVALLALLAPDLQEPEKQTTTFSLIRAILSRKYVVKEVYDLMDTVAKIMVTSQSAQVRELCRHAYVQFLLDYPHGPHRLKKQMSYLVNNINYEFETGRESVLEVFNAIISKFSDEVIVEYSEMTFVALVMALVNDDSAKCREMAGVLVKALVTRLDIGRMDKIFVLMDKWFSQEGQLALQRTAVQVFGLFVEAFGDKARKWVGGVLEHITRNLGNVENAMKSAAEDEVEGWEAGYYALNTFSKIVGQFPGIVSAKETDAIWPRVLGLLLHPHQWIRRIGSRLLGILFTTIDPKTRRVAGAASAGASDSEHVLVADKTALKGLAGRMVGQLDSELVTPELATQVVKNLFFIGKCMFYVDEQGGATSEVADEEESDEGEDDADDVDEANNANGHENGSGGSKPLLLWLCQKLSYAARADIGKRRGPLLRKSVFQFFAAISAFVSQDKLEVYLLPMISTLYRTANDETAKGPDADDLRRLANEVMELLQKHAGTALYIEVYNKVHSHIVDVRRERKMKRDIQAVVDPEARARRRLQKNEMKRSSRKRKAEDFASKKIKMGISKRMKST
ncbi:U3 snoRNP protein [Rhizophlyctis rosea]|uniref:U3 snoRNP protein n=1 Tax=Rhizophlyctis rosea TaxID=64517 RepID=A0AAD5S9S3_9FUNG|nr:U3 snoRNP protein [Rhizophlyctis rosea]